MLHIPEGSNIKYLPFVFFLPENLIVRCPTLMKLPRNIHIILSDASLREIVESDQFLADVFNAVSLLAFPHFGFKGWKENYTGHHPAWILSGIIDTWVYMLDKEIHCNLESMMTFPPYVEIPFVREEYVARVMEHIVKKVITEHNLQPILDVVRETPCEEDFEPRNTNVRKDFLRKWYHTRAKVKMVSLEACMEDEEHGIHEVEDVSGSFEDRIVAEDFCQRFKARLSEKDMKILKLRVGGVTYEEIADRLGYKNHSGVIKRIRAIEKEFVKYEEEQQ